MKDEVGLSEDCEMSSNAASPEFMLQRAEQHIEKLQCELKEKEYAISEHVRRWQFYEQIVKNLTTY